MGVTSACILLFRLAGEEIEVLVAHMGGPYWTGKDEAAWTIPKGEYDASVESPLDAAKREFREEFGVEPPELAYAELGTFAYSSGKRVTVFVADGAGFAPARFDFGEFALEWPPRSGRTQLFPEVDRDEWMLLDTARPRLVRGQRPAHDRLAEHLAAAR